MYWNWILVGSVTFIAVAIVVLVGVVGMSILALRQCDDPSDPQFGPDRERWNRVDFGAVERRARLRKLQGGRQ